MSQNDTETKNLLKGPLPKPTLSGKLINLRPLVKADAPFAYKTYSEDKEGNRLTGTKRTFTLEGVEKFFSRLLEANNRIDYAITLKDDPTYIGEVVLMDITAEERSAGFRIALAGQKHYNKGYGTEAMMLILKHGFETLGLHRVQLDVFDFNPRAIHVYEKIGFVKEGVLRDDLMWEGEYHDSIIMGMLEDEWFAKYGE